MGDFFGGGGGEAPPGYFEQAPDPAANIPGTDTLAQFAASLMGPTNNWSQYLNQQGLRTIDMAHGDYNPQTMAMHIPQFNPQAQMNNPWVQPQGMMQFPLGAYSYVPPGAHSMFNPMGNYGMSNGMQGIPPFNPMAQNMAQPDFMGPYGPGGQQHQQGGQQPGYQPQQPQQQKPKSQRDGGGGQQRMA